MSEPFSTFTLDIPLSVAGAMVEEYLERGAWRLGIPFRKRTDLSFEPPRGLDLFIRRTMNYENHHLTLHRDQRQMTIVEAILSTEHNRAVRVSLHTQLNPYMHEPELVKLIRDMPWACFQPPEQKQPSGQPVNRPTDSLFDDYYRRRAAGEKVTLAWVAETSGYTYEYIKKLKQDYDTRHGTKRNRRKE